MVQSAVEVLRRCVCLQQLRVGLSRAPPISFVLCGLELFNLPLAVLGPLQLRCYVVASYEHSIRSIIVEHLRRSLANQKNIGIVPIYCEYKLKELQTPTNLLASLWMELSQGQDSLAEEAKALYAKHTRYRTKPTLDDIISIVRTEVRRHSTVFLVVDALDECPEDGRVRAVFVERLQYILTATASAETRVRLLVTSRMAKSVFPNANEVEIRATDRDVERLISQRIEDGLSDDDEISQSIRQNKGIQGRPHQNYR